MEVLFVYGLVIIFFVALPIVIFILMKEPAKDPGLETSKHASASDTNPSQAAKSGQTASQIASYGLLVTIFALLFAVSIITQRSHTS